MTLQINTTTGQRPLTADEQTEVREGIGAQSAAQVAAAASSAAATAASAAFAAHVAAADPHPGKYAAEAHTHAGLMTTAQTTKLDALPTAAALAADQAAQDLVIAGKAAASHTHAPAAIGAATTTQGAKADTALQPGALPAGTTLPAAQISDSTVSGRGLLTAADAAAQRTTLELGNVNNTADADKPVSTAQAAAIAAATTADAIADTLETAPPADLARIQASVSKDWADVIPVGGIPGADLSASVQTSLVKADTALQSVSAANVYAGQAGINGLVLNGSAQSLTNLGFSSLTFNSSDYPFGAAGCFANVTGATQVHFSDAFLPVDANSIYQVVADIKQLARAASAGAYYMGVALYDVDGNVIDFQHAGHVPGSETTLAAPLSVGDTTISLASGANWRNVDYAFNAVKFFTYRDSLGRLYQRSNNPYSRYISPTAWGAGGVSGNTITLSSPWSYANPEAGSGGVWPAGTEIACAQGGNTYNYRLAAGASASTEIWERRAAYLGGGFDISGLASDSYFRPGTAKVKFVILINYGGTDTDVTGFGNIGVYRAPLTRAMAGLA